MKNAIISTLPLLLMVTACTSSPAGEFPAPELDRASEAITPDLTLELPSDQSDQPEKIILLPDPQLVKFAAEDNQELDGTFFPAGRRSAPVIVFMHWYPGDQFDWTEIAYWLQNRGQHGELDGVPWMDPSWFPSIEFR